SAGVVTTLAGSAGLSGSADGTGNTARFSQPTGVAVDSAGNVYVADTDNHTIRKVTPAGVVTTLAGLAGTSGSADGTGSAARFYYPSGVAVDTACNVYVADTLNSTIRKVTPGGVVTTLAGLAGTSGSADGTGSAARFYYPSGVAVDTAGNVYVTDRNNYTVRMVTPVGQVVTLAGLAGANGSADGTGSAARFYYPSGVTVDTAGNVYVADYGNYTIRRITTARLVTTIGGIAGVGTSQDGGGTAALFYYPYGIAVDSAGNLFVADSGNNRISKGTPVQSGPPIILTQPQSCTNLIGGTVTFTAAASGVAPVGYQWHFNGANLSDDSRLTGSHFNNLTITDVQTADVGNYRLIATNAFGGVASSAASLTLVTPVVSGATRNADGSVALRFMGAPNTPSRLWGTTNLMPPVVWLPLLTNNLGSDGIWQLTDTNAVGVPAMFYRFSTP
ncbi:MAG: immunoglobulin domain-containing protein, partial [Verrucomicrobia bacterium]|nr:immunoglobulin domain-containing protein [Verrucomicrobiota bacterium]